MITRKQFLRAAGGLLASLVSIPFISKLIRKQGISKEEAIGRFYSKMVPMIKDRLEYEGVARQLLAVRKLRQGEIQRYPKDMDVTSMMIREDGKTIEAASKWDKLFPSEFLVSATTTIPLEYLKAIIDKPKEYPKGFFEWMDRELDKFTFNIMLQEDRNVLKLLYQSTMHSQNILHIDQLDKTAITQFKRMAEDNQFVIDKIVINRAELADIRNNSKELNYVSVMSSSSLVAGHFGSLDEIKFYVSEIIANTDILNTSVPEGMIFILPKPEDLGIMPERVSLIALPMNYQDAVVSQAQRIFKPLEFPQRKEGAMIMEQISQVIFDTSKVIVAIKPNCVVPKWMEDDTPVIV